MSAKSLESCFHVGGGICTWHAESRSFMTSEEKILPGLDEEKVRAEKWMRWFIPMRLRCVMVPVMDHDGKETLKKVE